MILRVTLSLASCTGLIGCASVPERISYKSYEKRVESRPICENGHATRKISAAFAIYQKVPSGIPINEAADVQAATNKYGEALAASFFDDLLRLAIKPNQSAIRTNEQTPAGMWIGGILTLGIYPLIVWGASQTTERRSIFQSEFVVENNLDFQVPGDRLAKRVVGVTSETFEFLICREAVCPGAVEPFYHQKIQQRGEGRTMQLFTAMSDGADGIAGLYGSRVVLSGEDLNHFIKGHYLDPTSEQRNLSKTDWQRKLMRVERTIDGDFVIEKVTLDPTELCRAARPNTELYTH